MPATEAQIRANQQNAQRSTGPKTDAGKAASRTNSYKHGLSGGGVVMPEEDAAEVDRLANALADQFRAEGQAGRLLARRMALMSVRMDRAFDQQNAAISERVRRVMDKFVPPEGVDAQTAEQLRIEAGRIALFDPSKEACRARQYEAAAERCFFRTIKEMRQLTKDRQKDAIDREKDKDLGSAAYASAQAMKAIAELGSFLNDAPRPATPPQAPKPAPSKPAPTAPRAVSTDWDPFAPSHFDVPISIGKRR